MLYHFLIAHFILKSKYFTENNVITHFYPQSERSLQIHTEKTGIIIVLISSYSVLWKFYGIISLKHFQNLIFSSLLHEHHSYLFVLFPDTYNSLNILKGYSYMAICCWYQFMLFNVKHVYFRLFSLMTCGELVLLFMVSMSSFSKLMFSP